MARLDFGPLTRAEIKEAVADNEWQTFRLTLKGVSTAEKLDALEDWLETHKSSRKAQVQVTNYVNALKRGGQIK